LFPPSIIGRPDSPDPITITLLLFDSESLIVASIPLSLKILVVNEEFNILYASALP
jgi:HKD family nuclease